MEEIVKANPDIIIGGTQSRKGIEAIRMIHNGQALKSSTKRSYLQQSCRYFQLGSLQC